MGEADSVGEEGKVVWLRVWRLDRGGREVFGELVLEVLEVRLVFSFRYFGFKFLFGSVV